MPDSMMAGPRAIGGCLSVHAQRDPGSPALTFEGVTVSRGELDARANRMARALAQQGVAENDLIGIVLPNGVAHHVFSFAVWKLGATPLPLPAFMPEAELEALLRIAQPKLVIGGPASAYMLAGDFQPDASLSAEPLPEKTSKSFKAICSGGSTGRPKIILDGMPAMADPDQPMPLLQMRADDIVLHAAPIYHTSPFAQTNWALCWGLHVVEMAKFDAREWLKLVEQHKVTWAYLVPTMMHRIWSLTEAERARYDLSSLRVIFHTGAPCPGWLKQEWVNWLGGERIWELYSGTEGFGATMIRGDEWLAHRGSVGRALTGVCIMDEDGRACAPGEVGEIWFPAASGVQSQYLGAEIRERDGWRGLGDMGWLDAEGYLYIADRRTDMIVSGGANIYPAEIEAALEEHPTIASSVVIGLPHNDLGRVPHAIVELRPGAALDARALEVFLEQRLARFKLPYTIEVAQRPLRDDAGKVRRGAWRDACETRLAAGERFTSLRARGQAHS